MHNAQQILQSCTPACVAPDLKSTLVYTRAGFFTSPNAAERSFFFFTVRLKVCVCVGAGAAAAAGADAGRWDDCGGRGGIGGGGIDVDDGGDRDADTEGGGFVSALPSTSSSSS